LLRITQPVFDFDLGKQVAQIKSTTTIFNFFLAPSGNYFLVFNAMLNWDHLSAGR
jgi:hypothetical protein